MTTLAPTVLQLRVLGALAACRATNASRSLPLSGENRITLAGLVNRGLIEKRGIGAMRSYWLSSAGLDLIESDPACRRCGCTQERACPGGCYWAEPYLCSACTEGEDR